MVKLHRKLFKEYEEASIKLGEYYAHRREVPLRFLSYYKDVLHNLRIYLQKNGNKMPQPKYFYDPENKATHRFIGSVSGKGAMLNPEYLYRDEWKLSA